VCVIDCDVLIILAVSRSRGLSCICAHCLVRIGFYNAHSSVIASLVGGSKALSKTKGTCSMLGNDILVDILTFLDIPAQSKFLMVTAQRAEMRYWAINFTRASFR